MDSHDWMWWNQSIQQICQQYCKVITMGDMNTHSYHYGCSYGCRGGYNQTSIRYNAVRDTMITAGLHCSTKDYMDSIPSHYQGHTMDLVFTGNPELIRQIKPVHNVTLASDPYPIHITLSVNYNPMIYSKPRTIWKHIEATQPQWDSYKLECDTQLQSVDTWYTSPQINNLLNILQNQSLPRTTRLSHAVYIIEQLWIKIRKCINIAANKNIHKKIIKSYSKKYWRFESRLTIIYDYLQQDNRTNTSELKSAKCTFDKFLYIAKQKYKDHIMQQCEHEKQLKMLYSIFRRLKNN